jgi:hypothetical protein
MDTVERAIVKFQYHADLDRSFTVKIVGDCVELGSWDPNKGCEMTLSPDSTNVWKCNIYILMDTDIEYKYVFGKHDEWIWEELPSNRCVSIKDQAAEITDVKGSPESDY